jgi:hypothetical protein
MSGSRKKAIVCGKDGSRQFGYLAASGFVHPERTLELLDLSGRVVALSLNEVRMVAFVRDFNVGDATNPERLMRRTFLARPRSDGLWVRITFTDGEILEGLASADLALLDDVLADAGVHLSPPDTRANTQWLYIPRTSIATLQMVSVVTSARKPAKAIRAHSSQAQDTLFPLDDELQSPA